MIAGSDDNMFAAAVRDGRKKGIVEAKFLFDGAWVSKRAPATTSIVTFSLLISSLNQFRKEANSLSRCQPNKQ